MKFSKRQLKLLTSALNSGALYEETRLDAGCEPTLKGRRQTHKNILAMRKLEEKIREKLNDRQAQG